MPVLKNARRERFAQELAKGKPVGEAYVLAGYKPHPANPTMLAKNRGVSERVSELLSRRQHIEDKGTERAIERTAITKVRVLTELAKIGFANMLDYMKVGANGDPYLDFSAITRDHAAALIEVTVEDFKDGRGEDSREVRRVKFKLADKKGALVDIGKELGMFINRTELKRVDEFDGMTEAQLRAFIREKAADLDLTVDEGIGKPNGTTRH
jgi:phage terminase small subunit